MTTEWAEYRRFDRAQVLKKERLAGELVRRDGGVEFRYDPEYLAAGREPVASTLPLSEQPTFRPSGAVPAYFAGLLPEGRRLQAVRTAVKTSYDDELTLLLAVGADPVGDVRVLPEGVAPEEVAPRVQVRRWSEVSFDEVFAEETGTEPDRVALPGVQPKASARMISLPVRQAGGHLILKLDPPEFPHLCRNEWLMLLAAKASGLAVVHAELVTDRDGREALAVRRFDRTSSGDQLAVEDACQAMDRYPAEKYNLTTEEACAALVAISDAPLAAARTLLRWVSFAFLSCNGDLHAKNLSVGESESGLVQPTPAYDLPSSYPYGDVTLALPINGRSREDVGRADLLRLAIGLRVPERAAAKVIDEVAERADLWLPRLSESGFDDRTLHKWRRAVEYRRDRLAGSAR
jgi:serine/threonine-protein kinase HipA